MKTSTKWLTGFLVFWLVCYWNVVNPYSSAQRGSPVTTISSGSAPSVIAVTFSATPTYACTQTTAPTLFTITLTGNVTSSTLSGCGAGQQLGFVITQDGAGNRTHVWPTGFSNVTTITAQASYTTSQYFVWDGSNAQPMGSAMVYNGSAMSVLTNAGTVNNAGLQMGINTGRGLYMASTDILTAATAGAQRAATTTGGFIVDRTLFLGFSDAGGASGGTIGVGFSEVSPASKHIAVGTGSADTSGDLRAAGYMSGGTKFTVSGCSAGTTVGGATAGSFNTGAAGACTATVTLNGATGLTAPNGWSCWAGNITTTAANPIWQNGGNTTTATFALNASTANGDTIKWGCLAY